MALPISGAVLEGNYLGGAYPTIGGRHGRVIEALRGENLGIVS